MNRLSTSRPRQSNFPRPLASPGRAHLYLNLPLPRPPATSNCVATSEFMRYHPPLGTRRSASKRNFSWPKFTPPATCITCSGITCSRSPLEARPIERALGSVADSWIGSQSTWGKSLSTWGRTRRPWQPRTCWPWCPPRKIPIQVHDSGQPEKPATTPLPAAGRPAASTFPRAKIRP